MNDDVFDELESQLRSAVRARRRSRPQWLRRGHRRTPALVLLAMLVLAAGALAAGGVIQIGSPAEPHTSSSSFYALKGGGIVKGTVRLLPVSTPDPAGGPAWGLRVLSTKRGEGCIQVGRLLQGKLGALGQDSAFHDDGLFHEFAVNTFGAQRSCTLLDGNNRLFLNATVGDIPASAWRGNFPDKGCVPSTAGPYERFAEDGKRKPYPICPQADERNLYYGLLGPDAQSVTYKLDEQTHTEQTAGPEGAYLIVTRASPTQLFNFNAGGTQDVVPVDGPITELHYRDGATCHLTARSWIGGKDACTPELKVPVGWVPPRTPAPTAAQVAAPLHVRLIRARQGRHALRISFSSRVAIANAHSTYTVRWHQPGMPPNVYGWGPLIPAFPEIGETVTARIGDYGPALGPGTTTGEIIYQDQAGPGNLEEAGGTVRYTVGRFTVHVP
jgi:hypothetical protein